MPYDIAKIFSDNGIIQDTGGEDVNEGLMLSKLVMQGPAAVAAANLPKAARRVGSSLGGMLGLDTRDKNEVLAEQLKGADLSTVDGVNRAAALIEKTHGGTAALGWKSQMLQRLQENKRAEALTANQTTTAASGATSAAASARNAATNEAQLPIQQMQANTQAQLANTADAELVLANGTQDDLVAWREVQAEQARRDAAVKEEANAIDRLMIEVSNRDLGSRDRAAVREATQEGRELRTNTTDTIRIADEFAALDIVSGAPAMMLEKWRNLTGTQDDVSRLKAQFNIVKNAGVMKSLPPGPASDVDVALAQTGFPTDSWKPEQIASFMRGMAKLSALAAEESFARAKYLASNGGIDAGFEDQWRETMATEGFADGLVGKYGLEFITEQEKADKWFQPSPEEQAEAAAQLEARKEARRERLRIAQATGGFTL